MEPRAPGGSMPSKRLTGSSKKSTRGQASSSKVGAKKKGKTRASRSRKRKPEKIRVSFTKKQAKEMALLQLRIGRASHFYSMVAAFALAASGILLLMIPAGRPLDWLSADAKLLFPWLFPIMAGAVIALMALLLKWRPYNQEKGSLHFRLTVVAFLMSLVILLAVLNQSAGGVAPQTLTWVYPFAPAGISLTLVSLALTWRGWGRRKVMSIFAALLPMAVMVYGFNPIFSAGIPPDLLILTFMGSAVAILFAGSMLHIIASSPSVQENEMIRISNDRLQLVKKKLEARAEALHYKEGALRSKETDLDVQEETLGGRLRDLEARQSQFETVRVQTQKRGKELKSREKKVHKRDAELAAKEESLALREQEASERESTLTQASAQLDERERELAGQERVVKHALSDVKEREKEAAQKARDVNRQEKDQKVLEQSLQERKERVLERESQLDLRERALSMKEQKLGVRRGGRGPEARLAQLESRLLEQEEQLGRREVDVKVAEERLGAVRRTAEETERRAEKKLEELEAKAKQVRALEKELGERESSVAGELKELRRKAKMLEAASAKVKDREEKYHDLYQNTHSKASTVAEAQREVQRKMATLEDREDHLEALTRKVEKEQKTLTDQRQEIQRLKKDLEAREAEVKLRLMEREKELKQSLRAAPEAGILREKEQALQLWEKRIREKEQEMKNLLYQKEKEFKERERALRAGRPAASMIEEEEPEPEVEDEDKVPSGTPRLDDLLLGGIPLDTQVLFVGPAFAGKEIGILNFIAEGLKNGIPCLLLTTSRSPENVAKDLGPILPSFKEYEQLGLVRWVDASSPAEGSQQSPRRQDGRYIVRGPGDYEGILKAIDLIAKEVQEESPPYLRLAYMSLSPSLTQGNEKEANRFVQRLVNRMRKTRSVGLYAMERGMHSDQQIEAVEHQMNGAIHFRSEGQKNQLSVAGIGEVQTRDWVDYKYTNRALMIGSFMLERIR